ncbi:MAG: ABC transporter substrate-binding protein, partial [Lactobacillales bacterium]|nr:ABC transporter substrate-binding protein [Lactobacillales bacterium]
MKKILVAVLGLVVVLGIFAVVYRGDRVGFDKEHGKPVVKIGAILPLTGNLAYVGNFVKGAMEIAVYDANMRPNNKYHYEMVFEDNAFSAVKTIPVLNKLIFIDKVDALTTVGNSIGEIVGPIVEKNKVPHI